MSRHNKPDPGFAKYHLRPELDENEDESPVKGIMAKLRRKQHSFNESNSDDDSSDYDSDYELSDLSDSEIDFDESGNEDSDDGSVTESSEDEEDSEDDNEDHRFNRRSKTNEVIEDKSDDYDDEEIILFQPSTTSKPSSSDFASAGFVGNDEDDAEVFDFRDIEPSFKTFESEGDDIYSKDKLSSRGKRPLQREQGLNETRRRPVESTRSQPPTMILSRPSSNKLNNSQGLTKKTTKQPSSSSKQTRSSVKTGIRSRPIVPPNIVKQLQSQSDSSQTKHRNKTRTKPKPKASSKLPPASPEKRLYNPKKDDPVHFQSSSSSSLQSGEVFAGRDAFGKPIYKPIHEVQQDKPNEPEQRSRRRRKSRRKGKQKAEPNESRTKSTPGRSGSPKRPVGRRERKLFALKKQYRDLVKMEQPIKAGYTVNHHDDDSKDTDISHWNDRIALHKRLADCYRPFIKSSYRLSKKYDLENRMWKIAFHSLIDELRRELKYQKSQSQSNIQSNSTSVKEITTILNEFLSYAYDFYKDVLKMLTSSVGTDRLSSKLGRLKINDGSTETEQGECFPDYHHIFNVLGDLSRYRALYASSGNNDLDMDMNMKKEFKQKEKQFKSESKNWYRCAIYVAPGSGLLHNQLALLSFGDKREFDALYHFLRSLTSAIPFPSRESILTLFNANLKNIPSLRSSHSKSKSQSLGRGGSRQSNAKKPGARKTPGTGELDYLGAETVFDAKLKAALEKISVDLLLVRLCGMVFNKIDLDLFHPLYNLTLTKLISSRLSRPSTISTTTSTPSIARSSYYRYFFYLFGISASLIESTQSDEHVNRYAIIVLMGLIKTLMEWICGALEEDEAVRQQNEEIEIDKAEWRQQGENYRERNKKINACLVFLGCAFEYLDARRDVLDRTKLDVTREKDQILVPPDFWSSYANFLNSLSSLDCTSTSTSDSLILPEQQEILGFRYNSTAEFRRKIEDMKHVHVWGFDSVGDTDEHLNERVSKTLSLGIRLGLESNMIRFDESEDQYIVSEGVIEWIEHALQKENDERSGVQRGPVDEEELDQEIIGLKETNEEDKTDEEEDETIRELKRRRRELKHALSISRQRGLNKRNQAPSIELIPFSTFIIFDTNCYMGAFNFVKLIIEVCRWIVSVPLVVIQELEGLSNSTEPMKATHAKEALGYISLIFSSQNSGSSVTSISPNTLATLRKKKLVRLQTAQGNFLYDLKMTSESYGMSMNADGKEVKWSLDDVVLKCCEVLGGVGKSDQVHPTEEGTLANRDKIRTSTSVIKDKRKVKALLVTNDLNLKLKARIKGVEVVGVKELRMIVKPQLE